MAKIEHHSDASRSRDANTTEKSAKKIESGGASELSDSAASTSSKVAGLSSDRLVHPGIEGTLIQDVKTLPLRDDGLKPHGGSNRLAFGLQGRSTALTGKQIASTPGSSRSAHSEREASPATFSSSEGSIRSSSEDVSSGSEKHFKTSSSVEHTKRIRADRGRRSQAGELDRDLIRRQVNSTYEGHSINQFVVRGDLPMHKLVGTGEVVPAGTKIFQSVGWHSEKHLIAEATKHPELLDVSVLNHIRQLRMSTTGGSIYAYVYKNSYKGEDYRKSRTAGDVLFIDQEKGVMAALTRYGKLKTARLDPPEELHLYLLGQRSQDRDRNVRANTDRSNR